MYTNSWSESYPEFLLLHDTNPAKGSIENAVSEIEDDTVLDSSVENETENSNSTFIPPFIIGKYEHKSWDKRLAVIFLMPSGTCWVHNDHPLAVVNDGNVLEVSVK